MTADLPLFVYGTLMQGSGQAALVGPRRRGAGWIAGRLFHLPAGYPAVELGGEDPVHGEWIDPVPPAVLASLDRYEGVPEGLYQRVVVTVHTATATFEAWAWVMQDAAARGGRLLPSGRWRSVRRSG